MSGGNGSNGSGGALLTTSLPAIGVPPFKPSVRQIQYLHAIEEVLTTEERLSTATLAKRMNVTRQAVWMMSQKPAFIAWLNEELGKGTANDWPKLERKFMNIALRGSVPHAEFLAKLTGRFNLHGANIFNNFGQADFTMIPRP